MTFKQLHNYVTLKTGPVKYNLTLLLRIAENEFIERTNCVVILHTISTADVNEGVLSDVYDLPAAFIRPVRVEWDGQLLHPAHVNSPILVHSSSNVLYRGLPSKYWIENHQIRLLPKPSNHGYLHIWCSHFNNDETTESPIIPSIEHRKLADYVIAEIAEDQEKLRLAQRHAAKWERSVIKARLKYEAEQFTQDTIVDVNEASGVPGIQSLLNTVSE